jgi:hypothetical protein
MTDLDTLGRDSDVVEIGVPADVAIGLNAIWAKPESTRCLPGAACGAARRGRAQQHHRLPE